MSSSSKDERTPPPFSIQSILGNKNYEGAWTTIISSNRALESPEGGSHSHSHLYKNSDWDAEALDMRMKHQMKGGEFETGFDQIGHDICHN